jgi:dihydroneopterin aldolase
MLTVHLHNLKFNAKHGLYKEETILGNEFVIHISITQLEVKENITELNDTINYVQVYELVANQMKQATPLLETLAQDICKLILHHFYLADIVQIKVEKISPPISTYIGSVAVSFEMKRN